MSLQAEWTVELGSRSYPVLVGRGLLARVGRLLAAHFDPEGHGWRRPLTGEVVKDAGLAAEARYVEPVPDVPALLVTHPWLATRYGEALARDLEQAGFAVQPAAVPSGDRSKSLERASQLYKAALDAGLDRQSPFILLGGGVIGDLGGFAAATYLRGVPCVQVPTTLQAQIDAAIGGKVGINHPAGKNLIGAFHQPLAVVADTDTLVTLPAAEFRAGMAEVIKHGAIADRVFFEGLLSGAHAILERDPQAVTSMVAEAARIKVEIVSADETESGRRAILNFGHTTGHAIEAVQGYGGWRHGEAVAAGMVVAARLAERVGLAEEPVEEPLRELLARYELPESLPEVSVEALLEPMAHDKKRRGATLRWVLPRRIGECVVSDEVPQAAVREVLRELGAT